MTPVMLSEMISGPFCEASQMAAPVIPQPAMAPAAPHHSAEFQNDFFGAASAAVEHRRGLSILSLGAARSSGRTAEVGIAHTKSRAAILKFLPHTQCW